MTNSTAQHAMEGEERITRPALQAADAMIRRGNIRKGGIKILIQDVIERWHKWISTPPDGDFRTDESVHEQHFLASLPKDDWRVPYGIDSPQARELVREIKWCRKHGQSLDGLAWTPSDDPYAPANDRNHPYYLPKQLEL